MNSRRSFLKQMSGAALAASAAPSLLSWTATAQSGAIDLPGEDGMIVRSFRFVDLETPVEFFDTWLTPASHFFVRNHMHEPSELSADDWRLTVGGEVEKPFTLTLSELSKLETHSVVNTLECAGNGRSLHHPQVPGVQWGKGAVSTARAAGLYWSMAQQLAHLTVNGAGVRAGDLFASGTISGALAGSEGSLMEKYREGSWLADGDTVSISGWCGDRRRGPWISLGEVVGDVVACL